MKLRTIKKQANRYLNDRAKERRRERNHHARIYLLTMVRGIYEELTGIYPQSMLISGHQRVKALGAK